MVRRKKRGNNRYYSYLLLGLLLLMLFLLVLLIKNFTGYVSLVPPSIPSDYQGMIIEKVSGPWTVRAFPMVHSAGVHLSSGSLSGNDLNINVGKSVVQYKEPVSSTWNQAHVFTGKLNKTYDLYVTSLFYLKPDTSYDLRVILNDNSGNQIREILTSFKTQVDEFTFTPVKTLVVDKTGGGDFTSIQAAIDSSQTVPGTRILVKSGIYSESIVVGKSGLPGNWIQIIGEPGATLDGHDTGIENLGSGQWQKYSNAQAVNNGNLWQLSYPNKIFSMWRDNEYFYRYVTGSNSRPAWNNFLDDVAGQSGGPCEISPYSDPNYPWHLEEGYYYDDAAKKIYLRLKPGDTPNRLKYYASKYKQSIDITNQDWIWVEGFTFNYYGSSDVWDTRPILIYNGNYNVIRKNTFLKNANGVRIYWNDVNGNKIADDGAAFNRIEYNTFSTMIPEHWRYCETKKGGAFMGIEARGSVGNIIRHNELYRIGENSIQNQISSAQLGCDETVGCDRLYYYAGFETDVYGNFIHDNIEGLENDGHNVNIRVYDNYLKNLWSYVLSLQPGAFGPHWLVRNIYYNNTKNPQEGSEGFLKIRSPNIRKYAFIYHNTYVHQRDLAFDAALSLRMQYPDVVFRNNIFTTPSDRVGDLRCNEDGESYAKLDLDYNNYFTSNGNFMNFEKKNPGGITDCANVYYSSPSLLCSAEGVECHGRFGDPGFSSSTDFSLLSGSGNIDQGIVLGVLPQIVGAAPDLGALEFGQKLNCDLNGICEPAVGETSSCGDCSQTPVPMSCTDRDGDGYGVGDLSNCQNSIADCNDTPGAGASINPGVKEICGDGIDNNCALGIDEGCASECLLQDPSLALYLPFDQNNAQDSSGRGNHGSVQGTTWISSGKFGGAFTFDGVNDFISVPRFDLTGTNKITVSFWVKPAIPSTGDDILLEFSDNYNKANDSFVLFMREDESLEISIKGNIGSNQWKTSTLLQPGVWYHVVGIFDKYLISGEARGYVNGNLNGTTLPGDADNTNSFGSRSVYLGARNGTNLSFQGILDEVIIFKRVLSVNEIQDLTRNILCRSSICTPSPEVCDGKDNDCDQVSDEGCQDLDLVVDNRDSGFSTVGAWEISGSSGSYANDSFYSRNHGDEAIWSSSLTPGVYNIYAWWTYWPSRSQNAPYLIYGDGGTTPLGIVRVNQRSTQLNSTWNLLGNFTFNQAGRVVLKVENNESYNADAIGFKKILNLSGCVPEPAGEVCDGKDNDCDTQIDEGIKQNFYRDKDRDMYGNDSSIQSCIAPPGYVQNNLDCDDNNGGVNVVQQCTYNGVSCGTYWLCVSSCPLPPVEKCGNNIDEDCNGADAICSTRSPILTVTQPQEGKRYKNQLVPLQYGAIDAFNCGYTINGGSITATRCDFSSSLALPTGGYFLKVFANNSARQDQENRTFQVQLTRKYRIRGNSFIESGNLGLLEDYTDQQLENVSAMSIELQEIGKIEWLDTVNLTQDVNQVTFVIDLEGNINISHNRIEVKNDVMPSLNKRARITLYQLPFSNPRILRDSLVCYDCVLEGYSSGVLVFTVPGFSVYSTEEIPSPPQQQPPAGGGGAPSVQEGDGTQPLINKSTSREEEETYNPPETENLTPDDFPERPTPDKKSQILVITLLGAGIVVVGIIVLLFYFFVKRRDREEATVTETV